MKFSTFVRDIHFLALSSLFTWEYSIVIISETASDPPHLECIHFSILYLSTIQHGFHNCIHQFDSSLLLNHSNFLLHRRHFKIQKQKDTQLSTSLLKSSYSTLSLSYSFPPISFQISKDHSFSFVMLTEEPTPAANWWEVLAEFYQSYEEFPLGLSLTCLLYGITILIIIYLISFYLFL